MEQQIFINLPVRDLDRSKAFYESLGFTINQQFSDETGACVVISDTIFVMLLTHDKFKQFTPKEIADAHKTTEVLNALSVASKERVDELMELALNNGGTQNGQTQEYDFMYGRDFNDPDGHIWELFYMNMDKLPK
jgi:predicted lactoylglutathione lyase